MPSNKDIEDTLKALAAPTKRPVKNRDELLQKHTQKKKRDDLFYYGLFGFFAVFLTFIAPIWKKRLESKLAETERSRHE